MNLMNIKLFIESLVMYIYLHYKQKLQKLSSLEFSD